MANTQIGEGSHVDNKKGIIPLDGPNMQDPAWTVDV